MPGCRDHKRGGRGGIYHKLCRGFTLVELLVVMGIIAVLMALMVPALAGARRSSQSVQCASNLRQLVAALINYSVESKGYFPPNVGAEKLYWYNNAAIGRYLKAGKPAPQDQIVQGVLVCPADLEGAVRSYSMNTFASSVVSPFVTAAIEATPPRGQLWRANVANSSHTILLIEAYSFQDWPEGDPNPKGFSSPALVGFVPAKVVERFGLDRVIHHDPDRFGDFKSQICYFRHRLARQQAGLGDPIGRLNIAFADGHVSMHSHDDLVDMKARKSTYLAMWSPNDREIP
jgi:prepilin-type N-terminal cleavage/methylation domain-containing protein/prepilin-type processing-associated H-X9-DG protein